MTTTASHPAPGDEVFDYVVIGSGAGGGPVAANLAWAGWRVLLLEAGDDLGDTPNYQVPAFACGASEDPAMAWEYYVRHYGDDAQQRRDAKFVAAKDGVFYPRAGTLGGCTAHNAMITLVPQNSDWDGIAELTGDASWRSDAMRGHFERLEQCHYRPLSRTVWEWFGWNPGRRGFYGWLPTSLADPRLVARDPRLARDILRAVGAVIEALPNALLRIFRSVTGMMDPNDWSLVRASGEGVRLTPLAVADGKRWGTRDLVRRAERDAGGRLTIRTGSLATRVLLDDRQRATGVEYLDTRHLYAADPAATRTDLASVPRRVVRATREVIVAAGAFNTPQLLMLSGIGPRDQLERVGIPVRVDAPGVGRNLQDRYEVAVVLRMKEDFTLLKGATFHAPAATELPDPYYRQWLNAGGPYATNGAVFAVSMRSRSATIDPDLFIFSGVGDFRGYRPGYSRDLFTHQNRFTWCVLKSHTANRGGRVTLRSDDPRDVPDINFHYFGEGTDTSGADLEAVVDGVEFARELTRHLGDAVAAEECPGPAVATREQIAEFVRNEAWGHHASCSCPIGADGDPMAVLDSRFRVRGTTGLRVVDASVFPRIPGIFIVTAIYIAAEKASRDILADAR
jgi:choline dehydrogenase